MTHLNFKNDQADVNGLKIYYEIYGEGKPLVLIHGGGSTIQTSFGNIIPALAKQRQLIAVEMQAHGRTGDRDSDLSFEQDADDVAALLKHLKIPKADFLGFSNGGQTTIEIALRHPGLVHKIILASIFYKSDAVVPEFWKGFDTATLNDMPKALRESFLQVNNSPDLLLNMFNKDVKRMKNFKGWTDAQIRSIMVPTLIINGNNDVGSIEHAVEMHRNFPNNELVIFPGGHGTYLGAIESLENDIWPNFNAANLIQEFLDKE
ncbi:MAG TPA: alpha/beta hydrolase [Hanamia sp.]|nr:alpha/beta hydrolase [Hanamia sp.]